MFICGLRLLLVLVVYRPSFAVLSFLVFCRKLCTRLYSIVQFSFLGINVFSSGSIGVLNTINFVNVISLLSPIAFRTDRNVLLIPGAVTNFVRIGPACVLNAMLLVCVIGDGALVVCSFCLSAFVIGDLVCLGSCRVSRVGSGINNSLLLTIFVRLLVLGLCIDFIFRIQIVMELRCRRCCGFPVVLL